MTSIGFKKCLVIVTLFASILAQNKSAELKDPLFHENSLIHLISNITEDHLATLAGAPKPQPDSTGKLFAVDDAVTVTHSPATLGLQEPATVQSTPDSTPSPVPGSGSGVFKPDVSSSHVSSGVTSGADLSPHVRVC